VPHLNLKHVRYQFGSATAIDDVHLSIERGEFVSLLGPSGCGKSTTLRLLAGFLVPQSGAIELNGTVIADPHRNVTPERRNMALIFQSYAVWPHMTVYENVAYGLGIRGIRGAEAAKRVREIMEVVGIAHLAQRYPHTMSGGQQQRVALARALVVRPEVLLLDEPLSNLDAALRAEMRYEIRRIHETLGMTSVYVTHDQLEALMLSDRIAVMNNGRLEQVGTPQEVFEQPASPFVAAFIGHWNCMAAYCDDSGQLILHEEGTMVSRPALEWRGDVVVAVPVDRIDLRRNNEFGSLGSERLQIEGVITRVCYFGRQTEYRFRSVRGGMELRIELTSDMHYRVGEHVFASIDPHVCRLLRKGYAQPFFDETAASVEALDNRMPLPPTTAPYHQ